MHFCILHKDGRIGLQLPVHNLALVVDLIL